MSSINAENMEILNGNTDTLRLKSLLTKNDSEYERQMTEQMNLNNKPTLLDSEDF